MSRIESYLTDYAAYHRTPGNIAFHFIGKLPQFGLNPLTLRSRPLAQGAINEVFELAQSQLNFRTF